MVEREFILRERDGVEATGCGSGWPIIGVISCASRAAWKHRALGATGRVTQTYPAQQDGV